MSAYDCDQEDALLVRAVGLAAEALRLNDAMLPATDRVVLAGAIRGLIAELGLVRVTVAAVTAIREEAFAAGRASVLTEQEAARTAAAETVPMLRALPGGRALAAGA